MKKHFLKILAPVICLAVISGCKKEPETVIVKQERGYICENFSCKFVETGATYVTLLDCKSECADKRPGIANITVNYPGTAQGSYSINVGLGLTSNDVAIEAYLASASTSGYVGPGQTSPINVILNKDNLSPGTYYYKVVLTTYGQFSSQRYKAGVITINPNETTHTSVTIDNVN